MLVLCGWKNHNTPLSYLMIEVESPADVRTAFRIEAMKQCKLFEKLLRQANVEYKNAMARREPGQRCDKLYEPPMWPKPEYPILVSFLPEKPTVFLTIS